MALHKKLSTKARTDLNTDLNDYDLSFLPTPKKGPYGCETELVSAFDLEFFNETLLKTSRNEFQRRVIPFIGIESFKKIEEGIQQYVINPKSKDRRLFILKKSIIQKRNNYLTEYSDLLTQDLLQHLKSEDIESFQGEIYDSIIDDEIISDIKIRNYSEIATSVTKKYLKKYIKYSNKKNKEYPFYSSFEDINIYSGLRASMYNMPGNLSPDLFSYYLHTGNDADIYFERSLFSSYTICSRTAEAFMVAYHSRRRGMIKGFINSIDNRILSSFIVSPVFYEYQYEILVLPSAVPLYLCHDPTNEIEQSFQLLNFTK
jgi:hypothetical protein